MIYPAFPVTGPPASGKTALVNELARRGWNTKPEAARLTIAHMESHGHDQTEFRGTQRFQREVMETDVRIEANTSMQPHFLDRSLVDNLAFIRTLGLDEPDWLPGECDGRFYAAFYVEPLGDGDGDTDSARQNQPALEGLGDELRRAYSECGIKLIDVEPDTLSNRASFVEQEVRDL